MTAPASSVPARAPTPWLRHACHLVPLVAFAAAAFALALPAAPLAALPLFGLLQLLYALAVGLYVWQTGITSWCAVLGAAVAGWRRLTGRSAGGPVLRPPTGRARTAILLPVHEEEATRLFALAAVTADAVAARRAGGEQTGQVDIFVLSDTRSIPGAAAEERAFRRLAALRPADAARPPVYYRRRVENRGRKAGNVAEFCARWGGAYDFLLVLDADSLMSGEAMTRLIGAMEANPAAGLIQAMCYATGRSTLFARMQQFSGRLYGPSFQRGVSFWQGGQGNFWGHNAILRSSAFAGSCGLPVLAGPAPFGGEIMSHDTVEAALLLRAGHEVWMLPDGGNGEQNLGVHDGDGHGSWEETPTNLVDNLGRDRRWCQGNLQHIQVLGASGLKLASYYHLTRGLLHYLYVVPFLVGLVLFATIDRHADPAHDAALVALVAGLMVGRRLIGLVGALLDDPRGFGGAPGLLASAALDALYDAAMFPVQVTFHALFLAAALTGRSVRWDAQGRDDRPVGWGQAWSAMGLPLMGAAALLAVVALGAPVPAALLGCGLLAAIPIAVWTSRRDLGLAARRRSLFLTPDELHVPPAWVALKRAEAALASATAEAEPVPLPPEQARPLVEQALRRRAVRAVEAAA